MGNSVFEKKEIINALSLSLVLDFIKVKLKLDKNLCMKVFVMVKIF